LANMGRGAEGLRLGEGMSPSPIGLGLGECPLPRNFLTFWLKIVHFGVYSHKNSQLSIE